MLAGDFFTISNLQSAGGKITAVLNIDATHKIFGGHFPGQPVVPGVCMMQMVKEMLEQATGSATRLTSADNLKFLAVIDPSVNNIIHAEIKYALGEAGNVKASAVFFYEGTIFFKMNGVFVPE